MVRRPREMSTKARLCADDRSSYEGTSVLREDLRSAASSTARAFCKGSKEHGRHSGIW